MNLEQKPMKAVIFDVDNTLLRGQSQSLFSQYLYKKGFIQFWPYIGLCGWFILYKLHCIKDPTHIMMKAFSLFANMEEVQMNDLAKVFFETRLKQTLYPSAIEIIRKAKNEGITVLLMSNANHFLIEEIARYVQADHVICTRLEIQNGKLTGKISFGPVYGKAKPGYLQSYSQSHGINLAESVGYGDHHSDIDFLSLIGKPYAINPTPQLRRYAQTHDWSILHFTLS